jgi:hypothetical protein
MRAGKSHYAAAPVKMSASRNIRLLARYLAWANSLPYVALCELPEFELTKPRQIVFGNLIRTLNHVYTIDLVWQSHLEGRGPPTTDLPVFAALQSRTRPARFDLSSRTAHFNFARHFSVLGAATVVQFLLSYWDLLSDLTPRVLRYRWRAARVDSLPRAAHTAKQSS